jgi:formyltetrahydrofolate-dependent phosphoribosylglycinamide formyltransferase
LRQTARLAVLASGGGTNLQSLIDYFNGPIVRPARVELVIASRPGIGALDRALAAGVTALVIDGTSRSEAEVSSEMLFALHAHSIDIVVLAGYIRLVPPKVVERFEGRMLNIHPALLPAFGGAGMYGRRVHQAVLAAGSKVSGATVHLVGARYDEGPIIAQWPVPVQPDDTAETLAQRVLRVEHLLLPAAVESLVLSLAADTDPEASRKSEKTTDSTDLYFELEAGTSPPKDSLLRLNSKKG